MSEKLRAKFPATNTPSLAAPWQKLAASMTSKQASPVEGQSLQQKEKKKKERENFQKSKSLNF